MSLKEEAFVRASKHGELKKLKTLFGQGVNINAQDDEGKTALIWACRCKHTKIINFLLKNNADVNIQDKEYDTALSNACFNGYVDIAKTLLEKGANIDSQDITGETAFTLASWSGHIEVVKLLIDNGTNIHIKDKQGKTALDMAKQTYEDTGGDTFYNLTGHKMKYTQGLKQVIELLEEYSYLSKMAKLDTEQTVFSL